MEEKENTIEIDEKYKQLFLSCRFYYQKNPCNSWTNFM